MKKTLCHIALVSCVATVSPLASAQQNGAPAPRNNFAEQMFKQMDSNGDGEVSRAEYNAFYKQRFDELDANHDGKISHEEMEAARAKAMKRFGERMQEQFNQRFDAADSNHDGALSRGEAQQMPRVAQHFDEIDANHDGKVTREEIRAYMQTMRRGPAGQN